MRKCTVGTQQSRIPAPLLGVLCAALLLLIPMQARAQSVREESSVGLGLQYQSLKSAAEEQHVSDFPDVRAGATGTIVALTFDRNNADVSFFTSRTVSSEQLLATVEQIAGHMDLAQSDFITVDTQTLRYVDLEMNDYLRKPSRSETRFDFDLERLGQLLEQTNLPRPIVLVIEPEAAQAQINIRQSNAKQTGVLLTSDLFLRPNQIAPTSRLSWKTVVSPAMWAGAAFWGMMFVLPAFMPWYFVYVQRKQQKKKAQENTPEPTAKPDPAQVQEQYNKTKPEWVYSLLFLPLLFGIPILMLFGKGIFAKEQIEPFMRGMSLLLPDSSLALPVLLLPSVASALLCVAVTQWQNRREKAVGIAPPPDPDAAHTVPTLLSILPLLAMGSFLFFVPLLSIPAVNRGVKALLSLLNPTARFIVFMAALLLFTIGSAALAAWYVTKKTRQDLQPGDFWYEQAQELATIGGVSVKHVAIEKSTRRKASTSLLGTVTLTSKLLADLEPDEVRVVIAREIGHRKGQHALRSGALSLFLSLLFLGLYSGGYWWADKHFTLSKEVRTLLNMPIFAVFILPIIRSFVTGKLTRQQEYAADRFAVRAIGDPEQIIHALRKLHTLNAQPHHLKASDEIMQASPSLANRIEAIRRDAEAAGATSN